MKVLILHPDFGDPGGPAAYYTKLKNRFSLNVDHYLVGRRPEENSLVSKIHRVISDYIRFVLIIRNGRYDLIHVNPSLDSKSFLRDGIFLLLARMQTKRTIVFFRGWQKPFESKLQRRGLWLFRFLYGKVNAFIVLSEAFKKTLRSWGCSQPIYREVTIVEDNDVKGFHIHNVLAERQKSETPRVLFLSRILRDKGVYEVIDAVSILQAKYHKIELVIAGDGDELETVKTYIRSHSMENVTFAGYVRGKEKSLLFRRAHILCFPTHHGEGLPNTIIEAMAFGLPVITRPVGGIVDFFKNEEHGFLTTSKKPEVYADLIERLLLDHELYRKISLYNYNYAQSNFLASHAARRLEKIYRSLLQPEN